MSKNLGSDDEDDQYDPNSYVKRSSGPEIKKKNEMVINYNKNKIFFIYTDILWKTFF